MPFYEYECENCKFYAEVMQKISDEPLKKCPSCGKNQMKKLISAPNFRLKGGGWYETDFKSDNETKRNLAGAEKEEAASSSSESSGGESKAASSKASETKSTETKPAAVESKPSVSTKKPAARAPSKKPAPTRVASKPATKKPAARPSRPVAKKKVAKKGRR